MVEFVDYGNEEVVEKSKLRKGLDHHLFKLPFQVCICLRGITTVVAFIHACFDGDIHVHTHKQN